MIIPDIYSVRVLNPQVRSGDRIGLIADTLAEAGYTVALVGIFRNEPYDLAVKAPADGQDFEHFDAFAQEGGVDWFEQQTFAKYSPDLEAAAAFLAEKTTGGQQGAAPPWRAGFLFWNLGLDQNVVHGLRGFCLWRRMSSRHGA